MIAHIRDHVYLVATRAAGMNSFQCGLGVGDDGRFELALVSTWADFGLLHAAIGEDLRRPTWFREVETCLTPVAADHYELVGEALRGVVPLEGGVVHIGQGVLAPLGGERFFDEARAWQRDQLDGGTFVATHIGRRMDGSIEEAVYVGVGHGQAPTPELGVPRSAPIEREGGRPLFTSWEFVAFDALSRVPARGSEAVGVLLANDDREFAFATPGAAQLLGVPISRLGGMRVDDITAPDQRTSIPELWAAFIAEGSLAGPYRLQTRDGSVRSVAFSARANTPWPGYHVTVLGEPGTTIDVDDALSGAGLIARYEARLV
ncbi:MAG TPA: PAS domain-containing protein [Candidatus Limnocylindrales bacterium]|nr:PAS domain-containing protein [Candidatus Limnocylindrales bacterium]